MINIETLTEAKLASLFDHTYLKADASEEQMKKLCDEAKEIHAAMVAVNSFQTAFCKKQLENTAIHVGAAISFPLGQTTTAVKLKETQDAIEQGADEIDYVVNLSDVKNGRWQAVQEEMRQITELCHRHQVLCKVIFENCYLCENEIIHLAKIAREIKPDFIKTSTGFGSGGAKAEDVALMKSIVQDTVKVKAAGGIRDWKCCKAMLEAGAERIGTSSSLKILEEFRNAHTD